MNLLKTVVLNISFRRTISPWHQNDTVSFLFFSCGPVYPRQSLLEYPLLGLYSLGAGLVAGLPPGPPHGINVAYFTDIILALLFNHIFKIHLLNVSNHPHFDQLFSS